MRTASQQQQQGNLTSSNLASSNNGPPSSRAPAGNSLTSNAANPSVSPEVEKLVVEFKNIILNGAFSASNTSRISSVFYTIVENVLDGKLAPSYLISSVISSESAAVKQSLVLVHSVGLDIASSIWLFGCQV